MNDIKIVSVTKNLPETEKFFPSLYDTYDGCFGKAPYNEYFEHNEVHRLFEFYTTDGVLLLATRDEDAAKDTDKRLCLGFAAAVPLEKNRDVAKIAAHCGFAVKDWWFIADFGVSVLCRKQGLSQKLGRAVLQEIPAKYVLSRTNEHNVISFAAHKKVGYTLVPNMEQFVNSRRKSGANTQDRRIFMQYIKGDENENRQN